MVPLGGSYRGMDVIGEALAQTRKRNGAASASWKGQFRGTCTEYARPRPPLQLRSICIAEGILKEELEEDVQLRWLQPSRQDLHGNCNTVAVRALSLHPGLSQVYNGVLRWQQSGGGGMKRGSFLGRYATVMDAKLKGLQMAWESGAAEATLDSQGAIERACQLLPAG